MAEKQSRTSIIVLSAGIVASLIYLVSQGAGLDYWKEKLGLSDGAGQKVLSSVPQTEIQASQQVIAKPTEISVSADSILTLNEQGVGLVLKKKYWEGMFLFEKAIQLDPTQIVPIYNMAVTLTEMEMFQVAKRYLEMARQVNPDHPLLRDNVKDGQITSTAKKPVRIVPVKSKDSLKS